MKNGLLSVKRAEKRSPLNLAAAFLPFLFNEQTIKEKKKLIQIRGTLILFDLTECDCKTHPASLW